MTSGPTPVVGELRVVGEDAVRVSVWSMICLGELLAFPGEGRFEESGQRSWRRCCSGL